MLYDLTGFRKYREHTLVSISADWASVTKWSSPIPSSLRWMVSSSSEKKKKRSSYDGNVRKSQVSGSLFSGLPTFTKQPSDVNVTRNSSFTLTCEAVGPPYPVTVVWLFNHKKLNQNYSSPSTITIQGRIWRIWACWKCVVSFQTGPDIPKKKEGFEKHVWWSTGETLTSCMSKVLWCPDLLVIQATGIPPFKEHFQKTGNLWASQLIQREMSWHNQIPREVKEIQKKISEPHIWPTASSRRIFKQWHNNMAISVWEETWGCLQFVSQARPGSITHDPIPSFLFWASVLR